MNSTEDLERKRILILAAAVKSLEWSDYELINLSDKYLNSMVHIALEKADKDLDKKSFDLILNGDGPSRRKLLIEHIERTKVAWNWNYY